MTTEEKIEAIYQMMVKLTAPRPPSPDEIRHAETEIASDADLDGKYGDEEIRRDPSAKYWPGESFAGKRMSQCSAEYLDAYAKYKNACAFMNQKEGKEEKAKYIGYDRKSAARARGWAKRIREGYQPSANTFPPSSGEPGDDIPF